MERSDWLKLRRRISEERYDRMWASIYDENWGVIDPVHQRFVTMLAHACPAGGCILDAACGTGKYWPFLLASGRDFVGIDQSAKMLERAATKYPQVRMEKLGLQEMQFRSAFDLIICMDAMENVFPEDWPLVLTNFNAALKPAGSLYFTVEITDSESIEQDYQAGLDQGLPIVHGESITVSAPGDTDGGYHYYPPMELVRAWLASAGFTIKEEAEGDDYHHFWAQKV